MRMHLYPMEGILMEVMKVLGVQESTQPETLAPLMHRELFGL